MAQEKNSNSNKKIAAPRIKADNSSGSFQRADYWEYCDNCGFKLVVKKCELICPRCGFFHSCSEP